jgi:tripartite-type tricarboxylate transporter receptor subunit TctC
MVLDRRRVHLAMVALALGAHPLSRARTDVYPSRSVRIIVPFPAGSGTDIGARTLAQELTRTTGQAFTVENCRVPAAFVKSGTAKWQRIVTDAGIEPE